jgi:hypothetical protein
MRRLMRGEENEKLDIVSLDDVLHPERCDYVMEAQ